MSNLQSANPNPNRARVSKSEELARLFTSLSSEELAQLPQEEILKIRQRLNPYGRTIAGSDKYLNFSITQISHEYWKKLITTAFIGYLNRMCDEWKVPSGIPVVSVYDYVADPKLLDTPEIVLEKGSESVLYDHEFNREWMKKRIIVKEFLEEHFQFSPDEHVRSAYRPNFKDESRTPLDTMAARLATNNACAVDRTLEKDRGEYFEKAGIKHQRVKKVLRSRKTGVEKVIYKDEPIDQGPPTPYAPTNPDRIAPSMKDPNVTSTVTNIIPPHDMFGRFKLYLQENFEELREATLALYCEKPEFELAINPYSWHSTKEEAEAFKKQHSDEVIAEVFTAESGKWNFFDSFKEQRESVNFYNKNTIILEEMAKQLERDERLGQDLMSKRVEKEKKKNIIESGPDAENFAKWRTENSDLSKLGAKHIGDMADEDMPDDSVQVDVFRIAKGGLEITKDKFYSLAEAPKFVKDAQDSAKAGVPPAEERPDNI